MTMDDNFIDFKCPNCTGSVSFSTDTAGQIQECPECAEPLVVPRASSEFGHKIPIPITTPRLMLRRLADRDWKDLLEFTSDDELFRYSEGSPLDEEQVIQWLARDKTVQLTTPGAAFCLAIQLQAGGKVIGHVSLHFIDSLRQQAGFNVFVNRDFQRQGFGTEAVDVREGRDEA
jgi:RimJ/RimL family protein N-acetyltransferase